MNIVYTINDKFVPQVGAAICAICENNKLAEKINFFVVGQGISEINRIELEKLVEKYQRNLSLIDLKPLGHYLDFDFDTLGWNPIVLARLLLEHLLPNDVEKIIYLDGDTIVIDELEDLWNIELEGAVLGACIEATVNKKQKEQLGMAHLPYVNAGVLIIDLKKWKNEGWGEQIIRFYKEHNGRLFANDQDAINGTLIGRIKYLPPKYNFYNIYWFYPYKLLKRLMGDAYYYDKRMYKESMDNPVIIHYLGEERPWRKGNTHKYNSAYNKYLSMTYWQNTQEEEGWELYFLCWRIFNFVTKPFPSLRYMIINSLIPYFMKFRANQLKKK